jgi:hypothetical protein
LRTHQPATQRSAHSMASRAVAVDAWREVARALQTSGQKSDLDLALAVSRYASEMTTVTGPHRADASRVLPESIRSVDQDYQK